MLRKTKICCTIGPATEDVDILRKCIVAGMNVARLNFSHGTHEEHFKRMLRIREAAELEQKTVAILLDTQGPEIRTGDLRLPEVELRKGNSIILTTVPIHGDEHRVSVSYPHFAQDVSVGCRILVDDGLIELRVEHIVGTEVSCRVINGGILKSKKGVNVPGMKLQLPGVTQKDIEDIQFGIKHGVDFIAASFVRKAVDVLDIRKILEDHQSEIHIFAKIENEEGIENIDTIMEVSDGIMVARGDLGVEIPTEEVPLVQKEIIKKCNMRGIPVITATQMLDSMQRNPRPTRAEASDVANAIMDGSDGIMLSGETAAGKYPVEAIETMNRIALKTEGALSYQGMFRQRVKEMGTSITDSISQAVVYTSLSLESKAIISATESGYTARLVSKYRPKAMIIAVTPNPRVLRQLSLVWGVYPLIASGATTTDEMFQMAVSRSFDYGFVGEGDLVIITAGVPIGFSGTTNLMKVHVVGGILAKGKGMGRKVVTGPVVLGVDAQEVNQKMVDGAILVTRGTDKGMVPSFMRAGAVITEEDGLTSHAAVVGISLGIPVIVGVQDAMQLLKDEKVITADPLRGHIYSGRVHIQ